MRLVSLLVLPWLVSAGDYTPLDRYVAAPDASYRYQLARTARLDGATAYQIDLVSQNWLTSVEVDRTEWHHWVTILRPDQLKTSVALLFIDGGSNTAMPGSPDPLLALAAQAAGAVLIDLGQVPNEPLRFAGESKSRGEDEIIAYSWDRFLRTGDERWPARLPMTKAAVRAMDAATDFLAHADPPLALKQFIVAGGSKRGWTTWSTAAVDPRVIAIAPLVFDALNLEQSFEHHFRAYGFWSTAVQPYVDAGIMNWWGTAPMDGLLEIEDPYRYRARMTLPKYEINSTGDQFFLPDSAQFYFADLPGEKYLRYVPNTDHGLAGTEAASNLLAWFTAVTQNYPRPRFYWKADRAAGTITVRTIDAPSQVRLWQAANPSARDFRLETIGPAWTATPLSGENGIYRAAMAAPAQGWTAFMVELTYPGPGDVPLVFTTEIVVTPDVYPFEAPPAAQAARRRIE